MSNVEIVSKRPARPEWSSLMEMTEVALPAFNTLAEAYAINEPIAADKIKDELPQLWDLGETTQAMDMRTLDLNRYYALSLSICKLAGILRNPENREGVVEDASIRLLDASQAKEGGISALRPVSIMPAFLPEINSAYEALPPKERLLSDLLTLGASQRQRIANEGEVYPDLDEELLKWQICTSVSAKPPATVQLLVTSVVSGATAICDRVLFEKDPLYRVGHIPSEAARKLLRHPSLLRVSRAACGLLVDDVRIGQEFMEVGEEEIHFVNPKTNTALQTRDIETDDNKKRKPNFVREDSIVCPAAHVNGTVPLAMDMVADIIDRSCEKLERESSHLN